MMKADPEVYRCFIVGMHLLVVCTKKQPVKSTKTDFFSEVYYGIKKYILIRK